MRVSPSLIDQLGPPKYATDTTAYWSCSCDPNYGVITWKPAWRRAYCRNCDKSWGAGDREPQVAPTTLSVQVGIRAEISDALMRWHRVAPGSDVDTYLTKERGLTPGEITEHVVFDPELPDHAVFPLREDGQVVGWQARRIDDGEPKYTSGRTADGWLPAHKTAWGLDRIHPGRPAYLCEGIFDALYFPHGVAILGSRLHETQMVKVLDRKPSMIYFCYDLPFEAKRHEQWFDVFRSLNRELVLGIRLPSTGKDFGERVAQGERDDENLDDAGTSPGA